MGAIIHHWLTWIHPFKDGNGRTARLFLNLYFIQKNYPSITIKNDNRDKYYQILKSADRYNYIPMIEFLEKNMRESIDRIEAFINEEERHEEWKNKFKNKHLKKIQEEKSKRSYDYEVWIQQMNIFKTHLKRSIKDVSNELPYYDFSIDEYDIPLVKYLDLLENKKVSNRWFLKLRIYDYNNRFGVSFIFITYRFATKNISPKVKIKIFTKVDGIEKSEPLLNDIKLRNIGYEKDKLIFGVLSQTERNSTIISKTGTARSRINEFIEEVLETYFDI